MNNFPLSFGIVFRKIVMGLSHFPQLSWKSVKSQGEVRQLVYFESIGRIYKARRFIAFLKYHKTMAQYSHHCFPDVRRTCENLDTDPGNALLHHHCCLRLLSWGLLCCGRLPFFEVCAHRKRGPFA
jgi:hypothetical protein